MLIKGCVRIQRDSFYYWLGCMENMKKCEGPIIVFDGVCNLCEDSVAFIIKRDPNAIFTFVSAQSPNGKNIQERYGIDAIEDETVILIKDGKTFTHSDAGLEIAKDLSGAWKLLRCKRPANTLC